MPSPTILGLVVAALAFGGLGTPQPQATVLSLEVESVGAIPIRLNDSLKAAAELRRMARYPVSEPQRGKLHRSEPLPTPPSTGPPYALVQFGLDRAKALQAEHPSRCCMSRLGPERASAVSLQPPCSLPAASLQPPRGLPARPTAVALRRRSGMRAMPRSSGATSA